MDACVFVSARLWGDVVQDLPPVRISQSTGRARSCRNRTCRDHADLAVRVASKREVEGLEQDRTQRAVALLVAAMKDEETNIEIDPADRPLIAMLRDFL